MKVGLLRRLIFSFHWIHRLGCNDDTEHDCCFFLPPFLPIAFAEAAGMTVVNDDVVVAAVALVIVVAEPTVVVVAAKVDRFRYL